MADGMANLDITIVDEVKKYHQERSRISNPLNQAETWTRQRKQIYDILQ